MRTLCLIISAALMFCAAQASADAQKGQGYVSPMATYIDDDEDRAIDDQVGGGQIGMGAALSEFWNLEFYAHAAGLDGFAEQNHFGAGIDLQWVINRQGRLTPYLFAGIGYLEVERQGTASEDGGAYSAGAGLLADIFGSSDVALRAEYRYRRDDALADTLSDNLFSLGLQVPFGSTEPAIVDSDRDGVEDGRDRCPGTPFGAPVDEFGCADSDGDGVADPDDQCPETRAGARVDQRGCELDSDGDGVPDSQDQCPETARGARVDENGCELDGDDDGVVDRLDKCPGTRPGVQVDVAGCEIKEEIRLPGVTFETNSDRLLPGAEQVLTDAAATLRKNPTISVEVAGHTDSDGTEAYNESLSERRASTVRAFLVDEGVDADRMTLRGYGELQPIAPNNTAEGKAQNRRVVLRITKR
ncbi:MAG TPA: OmpA family protein [Woeseiaceae bacterium]|nr:OmpA family protein [Woeseiaceae bacterium]